MSKEFTKVSLVTLGITLVLPLTMLSGGIDGYVVGVALTALGLACLMIPLAIIFLFPATTRSYGKAMLLASGILLLASFTICTTSVSL